MMIRLTFIKNWAMGSFLVSSLKIDKRMWRFRVLGWAMFEMKEMVLIPFLKHAAHAQPVEQFKKISYHTMQVSVSCAARAQF